MTVLLPGIFLFWFGVAYELRLASYSHKLSPKTLHVLGRRLLGLIFTYSGRRKYSQATPGLLSRGSTTVFSSVLRVIFARQIFHGAKFSQIGQI